MANRRLRGVAGVRERAARAHRRREALINWAARTIIVGFACVVLWLLWTSITMPGGWTIRVPW